MKRIIISILGGVFLPIILALLAITIVWLFPQYNLTDISINGEALPGLIFAPIAIPLYIDEFFTILAYGHFVSSRFLVRTICYLGFDFVLYALLTYLVIWYFDFFKQKGMLDYNSEPPPPEF
ncbi:MAG: hypothetical protein M3033_02060 [Acidobacteriota bacterium]|nr:hypothetical protein [Acidobacteriota bacterium]